MIVERLAKYENLPDVWGEGAIFAFSGMDGETCTRSRFVATYADQPYELLIHTPARRKFDVMVSELGHVKAATGDVLVVESLQGPLVITFSAWHTILGVLPEGGLLNLRFEDSPPVVEGENYWASEDQEHNDVLVLMVKKQRFALAYGQTLEEAQIRAEAGLRADLEEEVEKRLAIYERVPRLAAPEMDRLLKKCVSVMKVNTLSAEGAVPQAWSTPDRVPHQHMWLWDSVFHTIAMNQMDPRLSWNFLKSVLDQQRPDGMIPHMMTVSGRTSSITQPPLLAWGVWENYQVLQDKEALAYALPRLEKYLEWDRNERDQNHNGLLEWFIEGDVRCRSGESGLDNSPRFDEAILLDAVDFSTFAALDMLYVSLIAGALRQTEKAATWQQRATTMSNQVHKLLWNEASGFYEDRRIEGGLTGVRAATGFLPLLLPDLPKMRAERLIQALEDPQQFKTAFPVPSVSVDHPEWSTDMWRGATWINLNYLIVQGLVQQDCRDEARWLAETTIAFVNKYYQQYGVLFEFFDSKDERPPLACDRKGPRREPYNIRQKYDSIRDYHWTAALTACLLIDWMPAV